MASTTVDIGGVLHAGRELVVRDALAIPEFADFRFDEPARVELTIRRVGEGIDVRGAVDAIGTSPCARCLEDVRTALHLDLDERLEPDREADDPLAESNVLRGERLDVLDLVRQSIDSALPYVVLCREDCPGLCSRCGLPLDRACRCPESHPNPK